MSKYTLNLSHTLASLEGELNDVLKELVPPPTEPLFNETIEDFVTKYGSSSYETLDELLEASTSTLEFSTDWTSNNLVDISSLLVKP